MTENQQYISFLDILYLKYFYNIEKVFYICIVNTTKIKELTSFSQYQKSTKMENQVKNIDLATEREDIDFWTGLPLTEKLTSEVDLKRQELIEEDRYWGRVSAREAEQERMSNFSWGAL